MTDWWHRMMNDGLVTTPWCYLASVLFLIAGLVFFVLDYRRRRKRDRQAKRINLPKHVVEDIHRVIKKRENAPPPRPGASQSIIDLYEQIIKEIEDQEGGSDVFNGQ